MKLILGLYCRLLDFIDYAEIHAANIAVTLLASPVGISSAHSSHPGFEGFQNNNSATEIIAKVSCGWVSLAHLIK